MNPSTLSYIEATGTKLQDPHLLQDQYCYK